jgi:hypothetical protein
MTHSRTIALFIVTAASLLTAGNAEACSATTDKLQALRRGMTYEQATEVMGCSGTRISAASPQSGDYATVEWNGSELPGVTRTQIDFLNGRLLSFTTGRRAGL